MPREISSRSTKDSRASDHSVGTRGRTPPVLAIRSLTAPEDRPIALAMGRMYWPAAYRSQISARSAAESHTSMSHLLFGDSLCCQPRWCVDPLRPPRIPGSRRRADVNNLRLEIPVVGRTRDTFSLWKEGPH